jgi:hypothetical protein
MRARAHRWTGLSVQVMTAEVEALCDEASRTRATYGSWAAPRTAVTPRSRAHALREYET